MKNVGIKALGTALITGGVLYPIPSLTRTETVIPVEAPNITIESLDQLSVVSNGTTIYANASGIDSLANSHIATGLLMIALGIAVLLTITPSAAHPPLRRICTTTTSWSLILLGFTPTIIMRLIDTGALNHLNLTYDLAPRPETQLALIITLIGVLGFAPLRPTQTTSTEHIPAR